MRIEPVFLVAPRPDPTRVPTRRAFLFAGGAFAFGSVIGGACGYSIGAAKGSAVEATGEKASEQEGELEKSGDARLDALRRLAVKAPVEDLVKNWNEWSTDFYFDYPEDAVLWKGADRLVDWALTHPTETEIQFLTTLLKFAAVDQRDQAVNLKQFEPQLRELRRQRQK